MNPRLVSFDLGNGFTKYVSSSGEGFFPSVSALEEPGIDFDGIGAADDFVISFDGETYAIGWSAWRLGNISVRTLDRTRVLGPEYRVLFAAALAASCAQGSIIEPVLSLPLSWYEEKRRNQVKQSLAGNWEIGVKGRTLSFIVPEELIRIVPEGFGTICAMALDRNGKPHNNGLLRKIVGVVDIGTKTCDLSMFDGLIIVPAKTSGYDIGLSQVYNIMTRLGEQELGHTFSIEQLDETLHGGQLWHGPEDVSLQASDWKHKALLQVSRSISGHIKTLWGGGNDVQSLILTGGGAQHLYQYLMNDFVHLEPVPSGPMANVLGGYQYGLFKRNMP
jgi:hypothetical protein